MEATPIRGRRKRAVLPAGGAALALCALGACTDPTFATEAGTDAATPVEAGGALADAFSPEAGAPASEDGAVPGTDAGEAHWPDTLVGSYVKREVGYGYESLGNFYTRSIALSWVTIAREATGELVMTTQQCTLSAEWLDGATDAPVGDRPTYDLHTPEDAEPLHQRVLPGPSGTFRLEDAVQRLGFDPARSEACVDQPSAASVPRFPDQEWLGGGRCKCPATLSAVPTTRDDCRLTDPDHDRLPAMSVNAQVGTIALTFSMVFETAFSAGKGALSPDGVLSLEEHVEGVIACVNGDVDLCTVGTNKPCPLTVVGIARYDGPATCAAALTRGVSALPPIPTRLPDACRIP